MKSYFIFMIAIMFLALTACEKTDETIDRIDDVFDLEPYDKIRDTAGNVRDEIKDLATEN
ncbi:MAG: hypothetical protein OEX82_02175 [Nitrosomonas sp.]|nr:hypothetical protein [Nitrosomonas sp.]